MDLGNAHIVVGDYFVNAKVHRIVEAIKDYEPLIDVQWLPPGARNADGDRSLPAFKIIYNDPNSPVPFTLFHVMSEDEFDEKVLWRIIHNDQRNGATSLSEYEAWEQAQKRLQEVEYREWLAEQEDKVKHIIRTHKNTYVVDKDLTIKDGIPFNAKKLKD